MTEKTADIGALIILTLCIVIGISCLIYQCRVLKEKLFPSKHNKTKEIVPGDIDLSALDDFRKRMQDMQTELRSELDSEFRALREMKSDLSRELSDIKEVVSRVALMEATRLQQEEKKDA
mmetsp:Transcript_30562/g.45216  ORF Transcript_30562/g.45216 Transcript_30562/m.45216 type:complete len:120 (-) Transcript_30562:33-392(-)|eukprot:CAMPEP_0195529044 /NCGR_PEP_ID=MMETSP0794_2-20130614/31463_1 /TAXON_ID=515487 /ORGANISM="Stephanopyxis turris, Strain CCMP 815" /LENGTH=119 /DNA_ID=CAMNT_0040660285 /DNA_START=285 /DNA_END=644 /DNA_ORIENTATION=+